MVSERFEVFTVMLLKNQCLLGVTLCCWACTSLKVKSGAAHPATQCHIPEELNSLHVCWSEAKAVTGLPAGLAFLP
jgi:hypothetical protein